MFMLVWIQLYSLTLKLWLLETLKGISNTLGSFVHIMEATKKGKYKSYAIICVHLNISQPLIGELYFLHHDKEWIQIIVYKHISFHYQKFHAHGHNFCDFPLNASPKEKPPVLEKAKEDFTTIQGNKKFDPK